MKRIIILGSIICCNVLLTYTRGQSTGSEYLVRTNNIALSFSSMNLTDSYLSPLPYSGKGIKLSTENRRIFSMNTPNLSMMNRGKVEIGWAKNQIKNAEIRHVGVDIGWGMHYHFRPVRNLQILTGGIWNIDFAQNKKNPTTESDSSNPVNFDFSTNINLSAIVIYDIPTPKRTLRLQAAFDSPGIGVMFVPGLGFIRHRSALKTLGDYIYFSSFHNKLALRQNYSIEIPFKNSTWRFGLSAENKKWGVNSMIFKKNDFSVFFSYTRNLFRFTQKHPAPSNFIIY